MTSKDKMEKEIRKPILTITGSDSTGGSGIQADIKTITSLGHHAATAITCITVQTTLGIQQYHDLQAKLVASQIEAVMNDVEPQVIKIGMIRKIDTLNVVVEALTHHHPIHVVYDPVVRSSLGEMLISKEMTSAISQHLLPLCTVIIGKDDFPHALPSVSHGLSNVFSSAVAVYLNEGLSKDDAIDKARSYVSTQALRSSALQGRSPELYHEFLDILSNHLRTNSDVAFYADRLNVSSRYLAQVCRRMADQSPKAIIDEHITRAIEQQLNATNATLQEIAFSFGFSSQAHFTKFFKKQRDITPSAFRRKLSR